MTTKHTRTTLLGTTLATAVLGTLALTPATALAEKEQYVLDTDGQHAFIQWRIQHLGYSWLYGRFNDFGGKFTYDTENPDNSSIEVNIDTASIDSNHAERDKHLRGDEFFHVDEYPEARFVSTDIRGMDDGDEEFTIVGDLTLKGVTKEVEIEAEEVGHGEDPWDGYRRGFQGTTEIRLKDFNIDYDLGPDSRTAELELAIEGIRQ
ncbi:MAG: YceI family protein [Pseudomonadota bacterium]